VPLLSVVHGTGSLCGQVPRFYAGIRTLGLASATKCMGRNKRKLPEERRLESVYERSDLDADVPFTQKTAVASLF